jgi:hypothetical protein
MATRVIQSPGVEIRERDLSLIAQQNVGTNVFITGYAPQGPTDEVIKISSKDELESIYGTPTNSAERYFYHGVRELLVSPANIYTYRLPYGEGNGAGFGSQYSALVYPVKSYSSTFIVEVTDYVVNFNYAPQLNALPLSGVSFNIQLFNGDPYTVTYNINGNGAFIPGDIVVEVNSNYTISKVISATIAALSGFNPDPSITFEKTDTSLTIKFSESVVKTIDPTITPSVIAGLDDDDDVLSIDVETTEDVVGEGLTDNLDITSGTYIIGDPVQVTLNEDQYRQIQEGTLFDWSDTAATREEIISSQNLNILGKAGLIILNKSKSTINSQFEGFYVGIADNSNINPASPYNSIIGVNTLSMSAVKTSDYTPIPNGVLNFSLSSTSIGGVRNSISEIMENLTDYDIDDRFDDDVLNVAVFKLRKSIYATEAFKLDYNLDNAVTGSIDFYRQRLNPTGGPQTSFFLENLDSSDRNIEILVNSYVSNKNGNTAVNIEGLPQKKIRILTHELATEVADLTNPNNKYGIDGSVIPQLESDIGYADNLYPVGSYSNDKLSLKILGSIPSKINRALDSVKNDEIYDIDVVVEAGLGTIHTTTQSKGISYYDDTISYPKIQSLATSSELDEDGVDVRGDYRAIFNAFENFCNLPSNTGGRGDCIFIADPIRQLLVVGKNTKVLSDKSKNFQQHIYWGMRHQFEQANSSYATVYANWAQVYDEFLGDKIWVPFSSVAAAAFAKNDAAEFPWSAPAGYTRGLVSGNVVDIAITPNQKQRDELYKSNLNPVLFSPSQGMAIFGQKTLQRKPSAFDRINVRRLFLALERPTKRASMFFVFEPNDEFTRTRFVNTLTPLFEYAKQNRGLYDYLIVCDERNNTPQVIDSNEMKCDIYIKPTRTAEYIIVTFTATRTDANFQELI